MYDDWKLACWEAGEEEWCHSCENMVLNCKNTGEKEVIEKDEDLMENARETVCPYEKRSKDYCESCKKYQYKCTRTEDMMSGYSDHLWEAEKERRMGL